MRILLIEQIERCRKFPECKQKRFIEIPMINSSFISLDGIS